MHENEPSPSNQPEHVTSVQTPHSGVHYDEYPVKKFDTPLLEAVKQGLVDPTPGNPAQLERTQQDDPVEQDDPVKKKSYKKIGLVTTAILGGAAIIVGSVIGTKAASDAPKNTIPEPDPKATSQTQEATPSASSTPEATTPTTDLTTAEMSEWDSACGGLSKELFSGFSSLNQGRVDFYRAMFADPAGKASPLYMKSLCAELVNDLGNGVVANR